MTLGPGDASCHWFDRKYDTNGTPSCWWLSLGSKLLTYWWTIHAFFWCKLVVYILELLGFLEIGEAYQVDPCRGLSGWIGRIVVVFLSKNGNSCLAKACRKARCHQHPVAHESGVPSFSRWYQKSEKFWWKKISKGESNLVGSLEALLGCTLSSLPLFEGLPTGSSLRRCVRRETEVYRMCWWVEVVEVMNIWKKEGGIWLLWQMFENPKSLVQMVDFIDTCANGGDMTLVDFPKSDAFLSCSISHPIKPQRWCMLGTVTPTSGGAPVGISNHR